MGQVNAQSITGAHGIEAREAAFELIFRGLVRAVSSDAHGHTRAPLLVEAGAHLIENGVPAAICRSLIGGCPRRLLARGLPSAAVHVA